MNPVSATIEGLSDNLCEVAVGHDSCEPSIEDTLVCVVEAIRGHEIIDWNVDFGCLSVLLTTRYTSYEGVESEAMIA